MGRPAHDVEKDVATICRSRRLRLRRQTGLQPERPLDDLLARPRADRVGAARGHQHRRRMLAAIDHRTVAAGGQLEAALAEEFTCLDPHAHQVRFATAADPGAQQIAAGLQRGHPIDERPGLLQCGSRKEFAEPFVVELADETVEVHVAAASRRPAYQPRRTPSSAKASAAPRRRRTSTRSLTSLSPGLISTVGHPMRAAHHTGAAT